MSSSFIGSKIAIVTKSQCRYSGTIIGKSNSCLFNTIKTTVLFLFYFIKVSMLKYHLYYLEMLNVSVQKIVEEIFQMVK